MPSLPVAEVSEKNGEISCSVEETNRVRALLGLKPLRINNKPAQASSTSRTQSNTQLLAQVSEKDGEVSCSVEETNRVRALLGLKPLNTEQSSSSSAKVIHHQPPSTASKKEGTDLAARVARAKKQRALKQVLAGATLGDDDETADNSASAWVERSRKLVPVAASGDEEDDDDEEQQKYSSSDLSGMKLSEGMGDGMNEGDSVVLTLKDQAVLKRGVGMRVELQTENDDMLEDIRLKESNSSSKNESMDEHTGILSHYDDEDEYGEQALTANSTNGRRKRKALTIGAGGMIVGGPARIKKDNKEDQSQVSSNEPLEVSFAVSSDFAKDEPKKPVKMKKRKKSKKSKNKKEKSRARVPMSMAEELELEQELKVKEEDIEDKDSVNDEGGPLIVSADSAKATGTKRGSSKRSRAEFFDSLNDDDDDLQEALSRARMQRAATRRELEKQTGGRGGGGDAASFVLEQVTRAREAEVAAAALNTHVKREVLTDTTDFAAAVQSRLAEENERVEAVAAAEMVAAQVKQEETDARMDVDSSKQTNNADDDDDDDEEVLGQEADVGKGIFGALALLRQRGELGISRGGGTASEVVIGRANDPQPIRDVRLGGDDDEYKFSFRLEHRDEQGRLMSQKEAFRSQSYKFHGIQPSRNKIEKRMRRIEQELSVAHGGVDGDTPLGSVAATRKQMQHKGQAHVVL